MGKKTTKQQKKRTGEGSKRDRILNYFSRNPLSTPEEAAGVLGRGITPGYVKRVLRDEFPKTGQPKDPAVEKPTETKKNPAFEDGQLRGGNGRTTYSIKGVREHKGPVEGLPGLTMQVMIVDGNAAANVREAQAFVSSMRSVLKGLDQVEKDMEDPKLLSFHALQVTNIMNAANRIKDQFLTTFKKREEDHQKFVDEIKKGTPEDGRTEWVNEFHPVEDQREEAPVAE